MDAYRDPGKSINRPRLAAVSASYQHGFRVGPQTANHKMVLRSHNQLLPEEYRRLMMMRSPKEDMLGHPAILSDNFSKINVRQAVALQSGLNNAFIATHDLSQSDRRASLERGQANASAVAILNTLPHKGPRGAGTGGHGLRRSIPTAPSGTLGGSKMATMQLRRRPLSGVKDD